MTTLAKPVFPVISLLRLMIYLLRLFPQNVGRSVASVSGQRE